MTLSQLLVHLRTIYGDRNRRHQVLSREFFLVTKIGITASRLDKARRAEDFDRAKGLLAMLVAWFLGHRNMEAEALGSLIWRHYPNHCPYRCQTAPCACGKDKGERMKALLEPVQEMLIEDLQAMFGRIYPNCTPAYSSTKILEEVTEWADALVEYMIHHGDLMHLEEELADVFAHCFGLANALGVSLSELLWRTFEYGCPGKCKSRVCRCSEYEPVAVHSVPAAS